MGNLLAERRPHSERHGGAETHKGTAGDVLAHVPACGIDETSGELIEGSVSLISQARGETHSQDGADPDGVTTTEVVADPVRQESSTSRRLANGNVKI